ncbi:hypothetical protein GUJ93_ZPchr0016g2529 [Zizania palustris]|uniref:Uncharacterized protein n=1 Tax=Zizania palustris TaxID=103762 RepID=A0A8J5T9D1_ZIZPA|nr:hypothetical protein GUJ93_ZPchr0016g2529 [Zizania palustris]
MGHRGVDGWMRHRMSGSMSEQTVPKKMSDDDTKSRTTFSSAQHVVKVDTIGMDSRIDPRFMSTSVGFGDSFF